MPALEPRPPLTSTFALAPGLGAGAEKRLWSSGVRTWDALDGQVKGRKGEALRAAIDRARADLGRGRGDFLGAVPHRSLWRAYPTFRGRCAYVDIETTGMNDDDFVTVIGVYDGQRVQHFERGRNLHDFPFAIRGFPFLVTFNGGSFDLPFLRRRFVGLGLNMPHWDLRWALRQAGYRGGLKSIEDQLGLSRPSPLQGVAGIDAVRLWHLHEAGDPDALGILKAYNAEDVIGLVPLAERVFNLLAADFPVPAEPLKESERPDNPIEYRAEAVPRLLSHVVTRWEAWYAGEFRPSRG